MARKVLIITYYWPPSAGGGVQRWLQMAPLLRQFGWDPIIFTPENPDFHQKDDSLLAEVPQDMEVLHFPIWEPTRLLPRKGHGVRPEQGQEKRGLLPWLRANLLYPDPKRFWVRPAAKFLPQIIRSNEVEAIITTGPPHSMHLIGLRLRRQLGLPWVADFRDPWSRWDLLHSFGLTKLGLSIHKSLEKKVLSHATACTTVSNSWAADFEKLGARRVETVTNGYQLPTDFTHEKPSEPHTLVHYGLLNESRKPSALFQAIQDLHAELELPDDFRLELGGSVHPAIQERITADPVLASRVRLCPALPRTQLLRRYQQVGGLVLAANRGAENKGHLPGKLFEYLAMARPIVAFADPNGDMAELLSEGNAGVCFPHDDVPGATAWLRSWLQGKAPQLKAPPEQHSRLAKAQQVAELLDRLA